MIGNLITPLEKEYIKRLVPDLMQLTLTLSRAQKALDHIPLDDAVATKYGGEAYDAIVTAQTLANWLLRELPLEAIR